MEINLYELCFCEINKQTNYFMFCNNLYAGIRFMNKGINLTFYKIVYRKKYSYENRKKKIIKKAVYSLLVVS